MRGEGGWAGDGKLEKRGRQRLPEAKHTQDGVEGKSKKEEVKQRKHTFAKDDNEAKKCIKMTSYMEKMWAGHAESCGKKARQVPAQPPKKANGVSARGQARASTTARLPHLETVQAMQ